MDRERSIPEESPNPLLKPVIFVHELCHYLAARVVGLDAEMATGKTIVDDGRIWQHLIIALAPTLPGLILLAYSLRGFYAIVPNLVDQLLFCSGIWLALGWLSGCWLDWVAAWRLWRDGY